ncbi:hypothetical protein JCM10207_006873 [Rhodosporidiobolus poonsookiae]
MAPPLPARTAAAAEGEKPIFVRSLALVASRIPPSAVEQHAVDSLDAVAFDLRGEGESVLVVGLYNPHAGDLAHNAPLRLLPSLLACEPRTDRVVVAGDFNLRHQKWEPTCTEAPLSSCRPTPSPFTRTTTATPGRSTCFFGNLRTTDDFVSCGLAEDLECGSNHRAIRLVLPAARPAPAAPPPQWAFRKADPSILLLAYSIFSGLIPPRPLSIAANVNTEAERLTLVLSYARLGAIPLR